jgi:hypothetical protein
MSREKSAVNQGDIVVWFVNGRQRSKGVVTGRNANLLRIKWTKGLNVGAEWIIPDSRPWLANGILRVK